MAEEWENNQTQGDEADKTNQGGSLRGDALGRKRVIKMTL